MIEQRLTLTETAALAIRADALVVEDNGWLTAARGLATQVDGLYPELRPQRERALANNGGPFVPDTVIVCRVRGDQPFRTIIWAVTHTTPGPNDQRTSERKRATPLVIEQVTQSALRQALAQGATHIVMPALGTRVDQHVLPPNPKKLPRYVMGAAQLIGIRHVLDDVPVLHVSLSLTQRDLDIYRILLGQATETFVDPGIDDD